MNEVKEAYEKCLAIYARDGYPSPEYKEVRKDYNRKAKRLANSIHGRAARTKPAPVPRWWLLEKAKCQSLKS